MDTMACNSINLPSSPRYGTMKEVKFNNPFWQSKSGKEMYQRSSMRRSASDNHLCYSINHVRASSAKPKLRSSRSFGIFPFQFSGSLVPAPLKSLLFESETSKETNVVDQENVEEGEETENFQLEKRANWMQRLLEIRSHWSNSKQKDSSLEDVDDGSACYEDGGCEVEYSDEEDETDGSLNYENPETFSRLLDKVGLSNAKLFAQLAFLSNLAYIIPQIKVKDLRRRYRLRFVTSSLEKKAEAAAVQERLGKDSTWVAVNSSAHEQLSSETNLEAEKKSLKRPSVVYNIAAQAAHYVQSRTQDILSLGSETHKRKCDDNKTSDSQDCCTEDGGSSPLAAYMAASTMTAVVAAGEKEKQKTAKDLQSVDSSPCEWFVVDDYSTYTRCFVIQGSDSVSSWHANLFFDPTKFEDTEVLVHRGIYEAAKGIYKQFLPEILDHMNRFEDRAKLQFTGHSLGGSLSLLVNLMLLTRGVVKPSALRPVVTFGAPFVFCGGHMIIQELGLDENHVHCVMMHRDIVPKAFSCDYPNHIAQLLKRLPIFRSHPCLNKNKFLYSPLGKKFILQPEEELSPPHPLLPPGSALYSLDNSNRKSETNAMKVFLNSPHPLDTLSDPTAYGSGGTILRDHDSSNYLSALNWYLRNHPKKKEQSEQRKFLQPLLIPSPADTCGHDAESKRTIMRKEMMVGV